MYMGDFPWHMEHEEARSLVEFQQNITQPPLFTAQLKN